MGDEHDEFQADEAVTISDDALPEEEDEEETAPDPFAEEEEPSIGAGENGTWDEE